MSRTLRTNVVKVLGALASAGALCWVFLPPAVDVIDRPRTVAEGSRPLLVFSTEGGQTDHELHAHFTGDVGDDITAWFGVRTVDADATEYEQLGVRVTFFGPDLPGEVTCQGKPVPTAAWDDLGAGARSAFAADRTSRKRGAHPRGALAEDPVSASFPQWAGTVTTAVKRNTAEDRNAAALHCVVPAAWVWTRTPRRLTALLPQVNYNGVQDRTDHQSDLLGSVALNRDPDWVLSESYPEAGLDAFSVNQELTQHWVGKKGQEHNFGYLTQPDLLFAARGTDQDDVRALTIAGIVLGIAGSLVVSALARLVDVVAELVAPERPTGT